MPNEARRRSEDCDWTAGKNSFPQLMISDSQEAAGEKQLANILGFSYDFFQWMC
jgi:hypothetical protein